MRADFAEVLTRESARLAVVVDAVTLAVWRRGLVEELMAPQSPYVQALRQTGDVHGRAEFLDRWRELIAETVCRLQPETRVRSRSSSAQGANENGDAQTTAMLILAVLHGGSILSQVAKDPGPLNAALDLALGPLLHADDDGLARPETSTPITSVGW